MAGVRLGLLLLVGGGGVILAVLAQVEAQFAEEEFSVLVQIVFLALFCFLLLLAQIVTRRLEPAIGAAGLKWRPLCRFFTLLLVALAFAWWSVGAYQASFYGLAAPGH